MGGYGEIRGGGVGVGGVREVCGGGKVGGLGRCRWGMGGKGVRGGGDREGIGILGEGGVGSGGVSSHPPPPFPTAVLNFFLDNRWGLNRDRLAVSKDQRAVRSVPGVPMLFAAERLLSSCHLSVEVVIGDVAVTQGRSYWACCVDPNSYLVKVGVGLESKLQEWFQAPQDVVSPR